MRFSIEGIEMPKYAYGNGMGSLQDVPVLKVFSMA